MKTVYNVYTKIVPNTSSDENTVKVRPFNIEDTTSIYQWRNAPTVRQHFIDSDPVSFESHKSWCKDILKSSTQILLIGEDHNRTAIGTVRFDISGRTAEISVYLDPHKKGKGLGLAILNAAQNHLRTQNLVDVLIAYVKEINIPSIKLFERSNFTNIGTVLK